VFTLQHPLLYQSGSIHSGNLPLTDSLLQIDAGTGAVSGIYRLNGGLVVRLSEVNGQNTEVHITLPAKPESADLIDITGNVTGKADRITGKNVILSLKAYSMIMIRFTGKDI
jgi:hypothetical protein